MNLASWILLLVVLAICAYIVYSKFVKKGDSCGCGCSACGSNDKKSCCD